MDLYLKGQDDCADATDSHTGDKASGRRNCGEEEFGASGWKSVTYCLNDHAYKQCGQTKNAQPPDPPHYQELRPME